MSESYKDPITKV